MKFFHKGYLETATMLMTSANFYRRASAFLLPWKEDLMSFLTSLAIIFLSALWLGSLLHKIKLPPLMGMLLIGILFSPRALNLISTDLLAISSDLRQFALIIILTRAGLSLKPDDLRQTGRPAVLLCFLPATWEIIGYIALAPTVLGLSISGSALTGAVMGGQSPLPLWSPRMLKLKEEGYGTDKSIPQMIMAGSSCDDVFVIVLFTALLTTAGVGGFDFNIIWKIPVSIVLGVIFGIFCGCLFSFFFQHFKIRDTVKIIILLSSSFLLVALEGGIKKWIPFSGLLAVISFGVTFHAKSENQAKRLSARYEKLWVFAEIILFVLVGTEVDISYVFSKGCHVLIMLLRTLGFRIIGVFVCLIKTPLTSKERLFCAIAYLPKATVQAAIGAIPLSAGLPCGQTILTCAVLAILITAPLGALATDSSYKKLLMKAEAQDKNQN